MSAPVDHSQFTTFHPHSHRHTAAMWRGAAIDQFATLEAMALSWLIVLGTDGRLKTSPADFVAWHRFKRLGDLLADPLFSPYNAKTLRLLDALESEHDLRTALAHGRMKASVGGITLDWQALEKQSWHPRRQKLSWLEALEALHRLDKLSRDLASQLGQIKRHRLPASKAGALNTISVIP